MFFEYEFSRPVSNYPPYNVVLDNEDLYVEVALAGFNLEEITVIQEDNLLRVSASPQKEAREGRQILHHGIARRAFRETFRLHRYAQVQDVTFKNGLLVIKVVKEVPEEKKPRTLEIRQS